MKKTDKNKPLPTPPTTAFGWKKSSEKSENRESLTADRMTAAMVEGKLDELLNQEMPGNEYARNLVTMMLGMTGMSQGAPPELNLRQPLEGAIPEQAITAGDMPGDVRSAIQGGNVQELTDMLRREHLKRNPEAGEELLEAAAAEAVKPQEVPVIDKDTIDALISIAKENNVTLDWIILRAIRVYVREYGTSGHL